jgi:hypothetical protein
MYPSTSICWIHSTGYPEWPISRVGCRFSRIPVKTFRYFDPSLDEIKSVPFSRLFPGTPKGAKASALLYSLIETAKANNCELLLSSSCF